MSLTRAQLENPGDLWASIANTILRADAFPFTPYGHRHAGAMDNNRVQIMATDMGRASDFQQRANIGGIEQFYYAHRQVRIEYAVVGAVVDRANANYAFCLGRLGQLHARDAQVFANANVQNLAVLDIDDQGVGASDPEAKTDRDRTTRNFLITYVVPPEVMAAAS
jgi:hypothetical protein